MTGPADVSPRSRSWFSLVPWVTLVGLLGVSVLRLLTAYWAQVSSVSTLQPYNVVLYYVSYSVGLVRRGLPGTVASVFTSAGPSVEQVQVWTSVLTTAAVVVLGALVLRLARRTRDRFGVLPGLLLLTGTPLTFSVLIQNRSRFDGIVVIVVAGAALLPAAIRGSRAASTAVLSVATAVAAASLEFSIAFVLPVLLARAGREGAPGNRRRVMTLVVQLAPALSIAAVGMLVAPDPAAIERFLSLAHEAGFVVLPENSARDLLGTVRSEIEYTRQVRLVNRLLCFGYFAVAYVASTALLLVLLRPRPVLRPVLAAAAWSALMACGLGVVGYDYGRWWALAFVTVLGVASISSSGTTQERALEEGDPAGTTPGRATVVQGVVLVGVVVAFLVTHAFPLLPGWDPFFR